MLPSIFQSLKLVITRKNLFPFAPVVRLVIFFQSMPCVVGTLNLSSKVPPEQMQMTRNQSNYPRLRKRPKPVKLKFCCFSVIFQPKSIGFLSFQATYETSLEYPQGILWRIFFWPCKRGSTILNGKFLNDNAIFERKKMVLAKVLRI